MGLADIVTWKQWPGASAAVDRYLSILVMLAAIAFLIAPGIVALALVPAFVIGLVWRLRHARANPMDTPPTVPWAGYGLVGILASGILLIIGGSPLGLKGPAGTGFSALLPSAAADLGLVLIAVAFTGVLASVTVFVWTRWSPPMRAVAASGSVLWVGGYATLFLVKVFFGWPDRAGSAEAVALAELAVHAAVGILFVAHASLWLRFRPDVTTSDDEAEETPTHV